jgi:hypothetical protein
MAAEQENGVLKVLLEFFAGPKVKQQELWLVEPTKPRDGVEELQIDYYPGAKGGFNQYARMGKDLRNKNVLVIKVVKLFRQPGETITRKNEIERAAVELLKTTDLEAVVLESIEDDKWRDRLLEGKDGRRRWLRIMVDGNDISPTNVFITKEQARSDFSGGRRKNKSKRRNKRKSKKNKMRFYKQHATMIL